jgi:hypothetical protein
MAATKLDAAGASKMKVLEESLLTISRVHAMVERAAIEVKQNKSIGTLGQQFKRTVVPMQGQLKGQFGMISDMVSGLILSSTRGGGGDMAKIRTMREGLAQIKQAIEFAVNKVKTEHAVAIEIAPD